MNFDALCDKVAERTGQKRGMIRKVLEESFDVVSETLLVEESVGAGRFGRFRLQKRGDGQPPRVVVAPNAPGGSAAPADSQMQGEADATHESTGETGGAGGHSIAFTPQRPAPED